MIKTARTTINRSHAWCYARFPIYAAWDEHPYSSHTHWVLFGAFFVGWLTVITALFVPSERLLAVTGQNLTQAHYRWRNDDGNESVATFAANEDTVATIQKNAAIRLRLGISNEGSASSDATSFRLQYAPKGAGACAAVVEGSWVTVPTTATSEHFQLSDSTNLTHGNPTTNVGSALTDPVGKTFLSGVTQDTANDTSPLTLATSQFTELEYGVKATGNATDNSTYCMRTVNAAGLPLPTGVSTLPGAEGNLTSAVIDSRNGFAYFGTSYLSTRIVKIRLSDSTRVGVLEMSSGEADFISAVIDSVNGFAYFGTGNSPGRIVKIRLSDFTRVGALTLNSGEDSLHSAVIDSRNGFAYFGTGGVPGTVVKIRLSDFTRVGALGLQYGENSPESAVLDSANGFAYFGTYDSPGIVVKIRLSDFTRVGALELNSGENRLHSAVLDSANGFAYFGAANNSPFFLPHKVVKIRLSDFTRVGALALSNEPVPRSAVLDSTNTFAYFGTSTPPGRIVKIRLSDFTRVGGLTLESGEDDLLSAVIDSANGFAYFGTNTFPGKVVKIRLSDLTRVGALALGGTVAVQSIQSSLDTYTTYAEVTIVSLQTPGAPGTNDAQYPAPIEGEDVRQCSRSFTQTTSGDFLSGILTATTVHGDAADASVVLLAKDTWQKVSSPVAVALTGVVALSKNDAWIVGTSGTILRWNGSVWATRVSPTTKNLWAIAALSPTFAFAVGDGGMIARWNGTAWGIVASPTTEHLLSVRLLSPTDGWAVGEGGTILRWNGAAWSIVASPTTRILYGVHALSSSDAWAVGEGGTILRWNGAAWSIAASPTTLTLSGITAGSATDIVAIGDDGTILSSDGAIWTQSVAPVPETLLGVAMPSDVNGWIVGDNGVLVYRDETAWTSVASPTAEALLSVSLVPDGGSGWAVGTNGVILALARTYPAIGAVTSPSYDTGITVTEKSAISPACAPKCANQCGGESDGCGGTCPTKPTTTQCTLTTGTAFAEDFNDNTAQDFIDVGLADTTEKGNWDIKNGILYASKTPTGKGAWYANTKQTFTDLELTAEITIPNEFRDPANAIGFSIGIQDTAAIGSHSNLHAYGFFLQPSLIRILGFGQKYATAWKDVPKTITSNTTYNIKIRQEGNQLTFKVWESQEQEPAQPQVLVTDSTKPLQNGYIAIINNPRTSSPTRIDNLKVNALTQGNCDGKGSCVQTP